MCRGEEIEFAFIALDEEEDEGAVGNGNGDSE